jgi:hypothetical protein
VLVGENGRRSAGCGAGAPALLPLQLGQAQMRWLAVRPSARDQRRPTDRKDTVTRRCDDAPDPWNGTGPPAPARDVNRLPEPVKAASRHCVMACGQPGLNPYAFKVRQLPGQGGE